MSTRRRHYILIFTTLLVCSFLVLYVIKSNKAPQEKSYYIGNYGPIKDIAIENHNIFIQNDFSLIKIDLSSKQEKIILSGVNFIFSSSRNKLIICSWENKTISLKEEYATVAQITILSGDTYEYSFHETVRFFLCDLNKPVLVDNYPNDIGRFYLINEDSNLIETKPIKSTLTQVETPRTNKAITLPIKQTISSKNGDIVIDLRDNIWLVVD